MYSSNTAFKQGDFSMNATSVTRPAQQVQVESTWLPYAIAFLRVAFGLWLLWHEALDKFFTWTPKTLPATFTAFTKVAGAYPFYVGFLKNVAIPNAAFFATLVPTWELIFSLCL